MGDVNRGEGCACVGNLGIWDISVPSPKFCCELTSALKSKSVKRKKCFLKRLDITCYLITMFWVREREINYIAQISILTTQWWSAVHCKGADRKRGERRR